MGVAGEVAPIGVGWEDGPSEELVALGIAARDPCVRRSRERATTGFRSGVA